MTTVFVTMPSYDDTTFYCSRWAEEVADTAEERGLKVICLKGDKVTRDAAEGILSGNHPELVLFNGHGSPDAVFGHMGETLVKTGDNERLLKDKIVHSLTCSSARLLGENSVKAGTKAYIGYENEFIFFHDKNKVSRPKDDAIAKPVLDSANQVPLSLVKGNSVNEAFIKSQKSFDCWIAYYRMHGEIPEAPQILMALMWDKAIQTFHGDGDAITDYGGPI